MAQPNQPGKEMSSRLLTMKFMQRTAPSPASSPRTPQEPAAKRQRMSNGSHVSTPASIPNSEAQRLEEALASEERKRIEAIEREGVGRGETKWYLSFKQPPVAQTESPLRIVSAGYSALDAAGKARSSEDNDAEAVKPQIQGRRAFGNYKSKAVKQQNPDDAESSSGSDPDDEEDEDEDEDGDGDDDDPTGAQAMIAQSRREAGEKARAERKAKRKADHADADQMAEERRKKHVKLNSHPGRISSGGGQPGGGGAARGEGGNANQACYKCGEKGHMKRDCPR